MKGAAPLTLFALLCTATALPPSSEVVVGRVRVQAYSSRLLRIEPEGPMGFFNSTSFAIQGSRAGFAGVPLKVVSTSSSAGVTVSNITSPFYTIVVQQTAAAPPTPAPVPVAAGSCGYKANTDVCYGERAASCADLPLNQPCLMAASQADCCAACTPPGCSAWVWDSNTTACRLYASASCTQSIPGRFVGGALTPTAPPEDPEGVAVSVFSPAGDLLWHSPDIGLINGTLVWPSPATAPSMAFADRPRFTVPDWGPTPMPADAHVNPALVDTNGFDFRNDVSGDTYVFLMGTTLDDWWGARAEYLSLTGPSPLLPDFAFGTWFTWWYQFTEASAKSNVSRWLADDLPIDVWALDMNWRNTSFHQDEVYNHPDVNLFPDFADNSTAWFDYLKNASLRTYFNDHPWPANNGTAYQLTSPEVNFRWEGLSHWMSKGLTFWWFDHNWRFSIPPPMTVYALHGDGPVYRSLSNIEWGSFVYHESVAQFIKQNPSRPHTFADRAISLTKYAFDNMRPGTVQHTVAGHHRYPVWWTGDGVSLEASVESMTDSGVYDFKAFVHSDCGGDSRPKNGGDLLRWTAHCALGTIHRFHGSDHRPWSYGSDIEATIRQYLKMRYAMMPSFISAGVSTTFAGYPLVARLDLTFPGLPNADSNHQYLHLNETLVAPIWDANLTHVDNSSTRAVWIPPGDWQDAWNGTIVSGGTKGVMLNVTQPFERIPMFHRRTGVLVTTSEPGVRVDDQDWSTLTLEAFPDAFTHASTTKTVYEQGNTGRWSRVTMATDGVGGVDVTVDAGSVPRTWLFRANLRPCEVVVDASVNGSPVATSRFLPVAPGAPFFPLQGAGSPPAAGAGATHEVTLPRGSAHLHLAVSAAGCGQS